MTNADYILALKLQKQFDDEFNSDDDTEVKKTVAKSRWDHRTNNDLNNTCNLVHPEWETLDPTPDVHSLFGAFDDKFFQGRLKCVTLEWSKRMYSCAGICYTHRTRMGMMVVIRLSEPLLKLRPRKDLVETLLHEMIHAYCSVRGIREGNGGHGPNFKKIMNGINKVAGTNITVYHSFHDEVSVYKTHWWRCNGICQNRKPFFGYVKRTSNRAPGPNDIWWQQHLQSCGGTFLKVKEPEKKQKSSKENVQQPSGKDIRKFFPAENKRMPPPPLKAPVKKSDSGTIVLNNNDCPQPWSSTPKKNEPFGSLRNVIGLNDIGDNQHKNKPLTSPKAITGTGYSLVGPSSSQTNTSKNGTETNARSKIRDVWSKRFAPPSDSASELSTTSNDSSDGKRRKLDSDNNFVPIKTESDPWITIDEEVMVREEINAIIDISSDDDDSDDSIKTKPLQTKIKQTQEERQRVIKQEIMDSTNNVNEDDIELIDDEFDDAFINNAEIADTSLVDDLFGEDTLLKEFRRENACFPTNSRYNADPQNDIITCPVCQDKVKRLHLSDHLDGCVGISVKVNPLPSTSKLKQPTPFYKKKPVKANQNQIVRELENAGYGSDEIREALSGGGGTDDDSFNRRQGLNSSTHACPVCAQLVPVESINEHLDICIEE